MFFTLLFQTENRVRSKQQLQVHQSAGRSSLQLSVRERVCDLPKRISKFKKSVRGEDRFRQEIHFLSEHEQATGLADLPVAIDSKKLS